MDFVIVGAGAVGAVVGLLLSSDGHRVRFWVRPAQRGSLEELSIERVGREGTRVVGPSLLSAGDAVPASDWVIVCVRGEQLDAALRDVVEHMGATRRVAIAAVSLQTVTERARAAGLVGPVFALHASFGSFTSAERPNHFRWFPFDLPTTVTPDGERAHRSDARRLARALAHAGLPTRSALTMSGSMRFLVAMNSVLALGWDLCGWQLGRLAKDDILRRSTALAMREAAAVALPRRSWLHFAPAFVYELVLRCLALFMGPKGREVWLHHGPKIRGQTHDVVTQLLKERERSGLPAQALTGLFERWRSMSGAR